MRAGPPQNDEIYCVILRKGVALTDTETAALPREKRRCD